MKRNCLIFGLALLLMNALVYAGSPLWTFTPLTPTTLSVPINTTATISYQINNQSSTKSHQLMIQPTPGISQIAACNLAPKGSPGDYCILILTVNGAELPAGGIQGGPLVCQMANGAPNPNQCYQPNTASSINITRTTESYTVGGTITGLNGTVTLLNNGTNATTISSDGPFTFAIPLASGSTYEVTVDTQPTNQTCSVVNQSGTINNTNVTNVTITCSTNAYTVGGTVTGLNGTVTLKNNGTNATLISANGPFTFSTLIAEGSTYNVTVDTPPLNQTCTVTNGSGTMGGSNVTNVTVTCSTNAYNVGGTVTGLSGTVTLLNNLTNSTPISTNGPFTFSTPIATGSTYNVTVGTQPTTQTCTVSNANGTIVGANVTNVGVNCLTNTTTLSVSATNTIPVNSGNGTLIVTNTGTFTAFNVHAVLPGGWAGVTQDSSNCTSIAPNNGTCTLSFTTTTPYIAQGGISITGDNISSPPTTAIAFTTQGYLIWSIAGSTVQVIDTSSLSPAFWGSLITTGATSTTDGVGNTFIIVNTVGIGGSAAVNCYNSTNGGATVGTWYLPALCQMGDAAQQTFSYCTTPISNINSNLVQLGFGGLSGDFWTSTEAGDSGSFVQNFAVNGQSFQNSIVKNAQEGVRCARSLTV